MTADENTDLYEFLGSDDSGSDENEGNDVQSINQVSDIACLHPPLAMNGLCCIKRKLDAIGDCNVEERVKVRCTERNRTRKTVLARSLPDDALLTRAVVEFEYESQMAANDVQCLTQHASFHLN